MLKKMALAMFLSAVLLGADDKIFGQGATFPLPIYKEWSKIYYQKTNNQVTYNGGGSGKGISAISDRNGDFGGTDSPLKNEELQEKGLLQFPAIIGAVVLAHNIDGVNDGELNLSSEAIAGIFSGKITNWSDAAIKKTNPNLTLPNAKITPIVRSDSSGTTFNFTTYLALSNDEWAKKYGANKSVNWGADVVPANSNPLVANQIKQIPNSIGYIEYAYKISTNLKAANLQNKSGDFLAPTPQNFAAAAANANFQAEQNFYEILAYGEGGYPIVAASFILIPKERVQSGKNVAKFFNFAFTDEEAKSAARRLGYEPLPQKTIDLIAKYWDENLK